MAFKKPEVSSKPSGLDLLIIGVLVASFISISGILAFLLTPLKILYRIRDFFAPFFEKYLLTLEISAILLSILFIWGIIYIIDKTKYFELKKEQFLDILGKGHVSKRRSLKGWKQILERLKSSEQNNWKLAILEADHILNEILKRSGYLGGRMEDKLDLITSAQLANVEDVWRAHGIRDKISKDPTFAITRQEAVETVAVYRRSFIELNLIKE